MVGVIVCPLSGHCYSLSCSSCFFLFPGWYMHPSRTPKLCCDHCSIPLIQPSEPSCVTMSLPPTEFEDASRVQSRGTHEYAIKVHPDFAWGSVAHGGYLFSLLWKAIAEHYQTTLKSYDQPDTVAMHVELLRPVPLGEAVIHVKDVRLGKGSSTVHVALVQDGKERVVGYAT